MQLFAFKFLNCQAKSSPERPSPSSHPSLSPFVPAVSSWMGIRTFSSPEPHQVWLQGLCNQLPRPTHPPKPIYPRPPVEAQAPKTAGAHLLRSGNQPLRLSPPAAPLGYAGTSSVCRAGGSSKSSFVDKPQFTFPPPSRQSR